MRLTDRRVITLVGVLAAMLVTLGTVLVAVGCGTAKPASDPFVGSWRSHFPDGSPNPTVLVIAKTPSGYTGKLVYAPQQELVVNLTRQRETLGGTYPVDDHTERVEIRLLQQPGHLTWANSTSPDGPLGEPLEWVRASTSTAHPTPTSTP
jgi:hypothetical protein